ncbi:adenosylcobinamide-phosphate synthase CbiB [Desulfofundulus thermocisternus]|jgi:adenosylcobinamide-phosphate synthase|uniref:adenosylcobinamide-phosphate synthase CbiB n=1 Tax=Desulfofundulus thermocisternus TaxID=42471 RepID=UPI0004830362|nr:adenosylcobinamide-phosphate synthase CbiB [Desulfofundulus thermocisternus]
MSVVIAAYVLDLLVGDPPWFPHPVIYIGKLIAALEKFFRLVARNPSALRLAGVFLAATVVGLSYLVTNFLIRLAELVHPWLALGVEIWLIATTFAVRGLAGAARDVLIPLSRGDLELARRKVSLIVGRDTRALDGRGITRATVETVAENIVDGFVSPLFYALIGGAPLAMAYRAVNTLDSMVGYRNEKYRDLGWASARLDDIANFLPARWTGLLLVAAAWLTGRRAGSAWRVIKSDARYHPSPNSGIPEAAMAGALGVRLGGLNYYGGQASFRAYLNQPGQPPVTDHIRQAIDMLYLTAALAVISGTAVKMISGSLF